MQLTVQFSSRTSFCRRPVETDQRNRRHEDVIPRLVFRPVDRLVEEWVSKKGASKESEEWMGEGASLKKRMPALMALSIATAALACGNAPTESLDDTDQVFLFELEYASSWVPTWTGIAIDRDGEITSYRREGTPWVPAEADSFTAEELQAKYGANPAVIGQLDRATMERRFRQIAEVGDDFSSPNFACADAGSFRYTAFAYNESTRRYRPLRLREEGDSPTQNRGGSAPSLSAWLRTVIVDYTVDGLQPFPEGSCTP